MKTTLLRSLHCLSLALPLLISGGQASTARADVALGPVTRQYPGRAGGLGAQCPLDGGLQACVNASAVGDTVLIAAGVFSERITINRALTLTGSPAGSTLRAQAGTRIVTVDAPGANVRLNRLTLTGAATQQNGGALRVMRGSVVLNTVVLIANRAARGGGLAVDTGAHATLNDSRLTGNHAQHSGGALFAAGELSVNGSTFSRNLARLGGAVHVERMATINDSDFIANVAADGGAIAATLSDEHTAVQLSAVRASKNTATHNGGALFVSGAGSVTVTGGALRQNRANAKGGAIAHMGSMLTLTRAQLVANTSDSGASSVLLANSGMLAVTDSVLVNRDMRGALIEFAPHSRATLRGNGNTFVGGRNSAIYAPDAAGATINLQQSTFSWFGSLVDSNNAKISVTLDGALMDGVGHPGNPALFKTRGVRIGAAAYANAANDDYRLVAVTAVAKVHASDRSLETTVWHSRSPLRGLGFVTE